MNKFNYFQLMYLALKNSEIIKDTLPELGTFVFKVNEFIVQVLRKKSERVRRSSSFLQKRTSSKFKFF